MTNIRHQWLEEIFGSLRNRTWGAFQAKQDNKKHMKKKVKTRWCASVEVE